MIFCGDSYVSNCFFHVVILKVNEIELSQKGRELSQLEAKIDSIEEKYITNDMDDDTYRKWKARYESERYYLLTVIEELNKPIANTWSRYSKHLTRLNDIANIYNLGDMHSKKSFINLVFDNQLSYKNGAYRTLFLNPLFSSKAALVKEKGLLILEQPLDFLGKNPVCAPDGNRTRTRLSANRILSPARLPVPPPGHGVVLQIYCAFPRGGTQIPRTMEFP